MCPSLPKIRGFDRVSDHEDQSAPQSPGTVEESNSVTPARTRCISVAWHGQQCKNLATPGSEVCKWHVAEYAKKMQERFIENDQTPTDPTKWPYRCSARVSQDDGNDRQCGKNAVRGLKYCGSHGGSHPAAKEMGERVMRDRVERHRIRQLMEQQGLTEETELNPLLQLQKLAIETVAMKEYLLEQVTKLGDDELVYSDRLGIENVKQTMQLYERAVERTSRLLIDMGRLDIDNRLAKITERQGDIVANILEKVLSRLELGDDVREAAKGYLTEEFRRLELTG